MALVPSPINHPNAFAGLSSASASALVVAELHDRLGVSITPLEGSGIVAIVVTLVLFAGRKLSKPAAKDTPAAPVGGPGGGATP